MPKLNCLRQLFVVLALAAPATVAAADDDRARIEAFVDGVVLTLKREHELPALTVSIVKDDALWFAKGYGMADLPAARPVAAEATQFHIGSVSKTFIWTAVMMLAERGRVDLDADVNTYLKQVRVDAAFGRPVTLRHLMHHRAGFEDTLLIFTVGDADSRNLSELLAAHQPRRVFPPGARTSYSNWGAALAAQIVEDASGVPYGEFLRREVLEPLGMRNTDWTTPSKMNEAQRAMRAAGYKKGRGALAAQGEMQLGAYWPAGGIVSTAADMARWMRFHLKRGELEGVRLLREDTHARMWTRAFNDRPAANDVAHGFQDRNYRGLRTLGHAGGTAAFLTNMILVPELGLGVFVSQSSTQSNTPMALLPDQIIDRVAALKTGAAFEAASGDAGALAELGGTYLANRRAFSVFSAVFATVGALKVSPVSADALVVSAPGANKQYRPVAAERDVFEAADGGRIAFIRDGGGRVLALADSMGVHTFERVRFWASPDVLFIVLGVAVLLSLTTLLGFWRRFGRGSGDGWAGAAASGAGVIAALATLAFAACTGVMAAVMMNVDISTLPGNYPAPPMFAMHYAGWGVIFAAALMPAALVPAWLMSDWRLWRRLHFSLFALALACLAFLLWHWKVIGAPVM